MICQRFVIWGLEISFDLGSEDFGLGFGIWYLGFGILQPKIWDFDIEIWFGICPPLLHPGIHHHREASCSTRHVHPITRQGRSPNCVWFSLSAANDRQKWPRCVLWIFIAFLGSAQNFTVTSHNDCVRVRIRHSQRGLEAKSLTLASASGPRNWHRPQSFVLDLEIQFHKNTELSFLIVGDSRNNRSSTALQQRTTSQNPTYKRRARGGDPGGQEGQLTPTFLSAVLRLHFYLMNIAIRLPLTSCDLH